MKGKFILHLLLSLFWYAVIMGCLTLADRSTGIADAVAIFIAVAVVCILKWYFGNTD